jgi:hypothetical protein
MRILPPVEQEIRRSIRDARAKDPLITITKLHRNTADEGAPRPLARDVIEAAKSVVMLDLALLNAEIANGMYEKPIELIAKEIHYEPLPDEIRAVIIASWKRGGMLPAATIEHMVPSSI